MSNPTETLFNLLKKRGYTDLVFTEVERLIDAGADVNYRQEKYPFETTLCRALDDWDEHNVLRMVKLLVAHGADVNLDADRFYPIWFAIQKRFLSVVDHLLISGVNEDLDGALRQAIETNNFAIVSRLLTQGVNCELHQGTNESFLIYCNEAYRCREKPEELAGLEIAKLLLDSGADPNGIDNDGHPIGEAVRYGFLELASLLIERGGIVTSNHIFSTYYRSCLELLIQHGADINHKNHHGQNKLMDAVTQDELELIPTLIALGIDIYATDSKGLTALHQAVSYGNAKKLKPLLPYYDLEKCNQIYPLESLSQENNIRSLLGLSLIESDIELPDNLLEFCQSDPVFIQLKNKTERLYELMTEKNCMIDGYLMPWDVFLSREIIEALLKNIVTSASQWKGHNIQAIHLEYAGSVTDPFDSCALASGYAECDDSLKARKLLFADTGSIDFQLFFESIDELVESFPKLYSEIHEYLSLVSFIYFHIAMSHYIYTTEFQELTFAETFFMFGNEHDYDPILIFKKSH